MSEFQSFSDLCWIVGVGVFIYIVYNFIYIVVFRDQSNENQELRRTTKSYPIPQEERSNVIENIQREPSDCLVQQIRSLDIHLTSNFDECRELIETLILHCNEYAAIGFDCEWVSAGKRGKVALLQLASHRGFCVLIQLCKLRRIPKELKDILADETIVKVGVDPKSDAKYLKQDYDIDVNSTLDLRYMAELVCCQPGGLGKMSQQYLNIMPSKKNWRMHLRWEDAELSQEQIDYAAKDAADGIELFIFFTKHMQKIKNGYNVFEDFTSAEFCNCLDKNYVSRQQANTKKIKVKKEKKTKVTMINANAE